MWGLVLSLALQGVVAEQQQVAMNVETSPEIAAAEPQAEAPAEPQRKRVCRTVLDNRTGLIAKQRKVCREIAASDTN